MKLIKLTLKRPFVDIKTAKSFVYINVDSIGHISADIDDKQVKYTIVGTTCHNNGGFKVFETPNEILEKIKQATNN